MDSLIYFFLLFVLFTAVFIYGYREASDIGNKTLKVTLKDEIDPVLRNAEVQTDGYLCNFIRVNDKIFYRLEKSYSNTNREYEVNNLWLNRMAVAVCIGLLLLIVIRGGVRDMVPATGKFIVVLVATVACLAVVFLSDLSEYKHVDRAYVVGRVQKDMLAELNK